MTMSQDIWRTLCTKVDDLKFTNAGGNKIRGTMMPPIFSMGCSRSFQSSAIKERDRSDHRHKAREPPSIPTPQAKQEPWRQTIGAILLAGESMVMTLKPRMHKIAAYFQIFKSSTKFPSQRIKNQVNRRFLQSGMAKTLKVVHSGNFWTARSAKSETGITPSFGLRLKRMTTRWKDNFINISIDLYFGICSIEYTGEIP